MTTSAENTNLAIVATHPIQYQVPWFQSLSKLNDLKLKIYYIFVPDDHQQGKGFDHAFHWDISLLDDYNWSILKSRAGNNSHRFFGTRIYQFRQQLQKDQIDVCLITGWQSLGLLQAAFSCRKLNIKTLVRGDSNSVRVRSFWNNLLHRIFFKNFDAFLAVGKENKRFYLENRVDPDRIFWCPHFVDNSRFIRQAEAAKTKRQALRKYWGILEHNVCFVFAGKLEPKKRLLDLLEALDIARKIDNSIQLLVVGSGEQEIQLRQLAIGNSSPVNFAGFLNQTEISDAYVAADCLVLPSDDGETWGLVVNEAMASGIPVLISDKVGCGADLLISEKTGLTFNCGNIQDLSEKIIWMADNHDKLTSMGNSAREHIQKYSIENATQGLLAAIDALKV